VRQHSAFDVGPAGGSRLYGEGLHTCSLETEA
jgi:hypothetical protein